MPPTPDAPATDPYAEYEKSLDRLVMIGEPVCDQVRAAFHAGWKARETAPNTLILDTTNAQMVTVQNCNAAAPTLVPFP